MGTTVSTRDPPPDVVGSDVNAIFQGMTDDVIARQQARRAAGLPPQLSPAYQPPQPTALQPPAPATPPTPGPQQSPAPWAQPPGQPLPSPSQVAVGTPQIQLTPQVVQPQPQPPEQLPARVGEKPPLQNMPALWNGDQRGPSGQSKQQFLVGRMMHESQGDPLALNYVARQNPRAYDAGYTAQGLLQDVNSTWASGVKWAAADPQRYPMSVDPRQYKTAREAPWDVQWQVNSAIYDHAGEQPWREQGGGFSAYAKGVRDEYQSPDQRTPHQNYLPAEPRSFHQWGQEPTGAPARPQDAGGIFSKFAPLLLGIASLTLRLPLSSAVTAYSAMSRAQYNGQQEAYERSRTQYQDAWKEASAKQNLESQDYGDAFATFGENNPQGLQQTLAQLALKYNDPQMLRLAEQGDLNGAHRLQAQRDMLNQNLVKGSKAIEEQRDREATDAAVNAMDRQWHDKYVQDNGHEPSADEAAIAHNEHIGEAGRAGTKDPRAAGSSVEAPLYSVLKDGKDTGKRVRLGKSGGYVDAATNQPWQPGPGETVEETPRGRGDTSEKPVQEKTQIELDAAKARTDDWANAQNPPVKPDSNAYKEHLAEELQKKASAGTKPSDYKDYTWEDSAGNKHGPLSAAIVPGKGLVDPQGNPIDAKPGTIRGVGTGQTSVPPQSAAAVPESWKGQPYQAPPGVDAGLWAQAVNWAEQGRPPVGLGGRASSMYQAVEPLVPAAMKALGIQSLSEQAIKYAARQHATNSIETGFGSGVLGRNLVSLNTVADHIGLFRQYAEALRNGDVQRISQLTNRIATEAGSPEVIDYALAGRITGDEVVRLLTTTGGTLADREDIASRLASYNSPEQFEGAANTLSNYVRGRYTPLRQQYARGDPERERYFDNNMVTPEARQLFQAPQAPIPGANQVQPMTEQQYNDAPSGTRYRMPNDPPDTVRVKP